MASNQGATIHSEHDSVLGRGCWPKMRRTCCRINFLITFLPVSLIVVNAIITSLTNYYVSDYSHGQSNRETQDVILNYVHRVTNDLLDRVSSLPFVYRDRLIGYPGEADLSDHQYVDFATSHAAVVLETLSNADRLRVTIADLENNILIFEKSPLELFALWTNSTEHVLDPVRQKRYGPLWKIPITSQLIGSSPYPTSTPAYDETYELRSEFSLDDLSWYEAGMNSTSGVNDSVTVETICVCGYMYLWTAVRYYDSNGTFVGLVGSAVAVEYVGVFLQDLDLDDQTVVLINRATTHIIASNRPDEIPTTFIPSDGIPRLYHGYNTPHKLLRLVYEDVVGLTNNFQLDVNAVFTKVRTIHGNIVNAHEFVVNEIPFLVITMIPKSVVFHLTNMMSLVAASVSFVCGVCAAIATIVLGCMITTPLSRMIQELRTLEDMNLDVTVGTKKSTLLEVRRIQVALYFLLEKLKEYKAFLPPDLLPTSGGSAATPAGKDVQLSIMSSDWDAHSSQNLPSIMLSEVGTEATPSDGIIDISGGRSSSRESARPMDRRFLVGAQGSRYVTIAHCRLVLGDKVALSEGYDIFSRFLNLVAECLTATNGHLLTFVPRKAVLGWNVISLSSTHAYLAARCCIKCLLEFSEFADEVDDGHGMHIHFGIATDQCSWGTLGTAAQKKRVFDGPAMMKAVLLSEIAVSENFPILCCELTYNDLASRSHVLEDRLLLFRVDQLITPRSVSGLFSIKPLQRRDADYDVKFDNFSRFNTILDTFSRTLQMPILLASTPSEFELGEDGMNFAALVKLLAKRFRSYEAEHPGSSIEDMWEAKWRTGRKRTDRVFLLFRDRFY